MRKILETVDLGRLSDQVEPVADFLKEHVQGRIRTKGHQILVEGVKHREVKLLLHKFLRHAGLEGFRILSHEGILQVVPQHSAEPSRHEVGTAPPAAATMPYFFPGTPGPVPVERKRKKSQH